jgi:hypothetical protein
MCVWLSIGCSRLALAMVALRASAGFFLTVAIATLFVTEFQMKAESAPGSGIEGTVTVSPTHGGPIKEGEPDSAPMANAALVIETAGGSAKTVTTDGQGHFKIELPPGRYSLRTEKTGMRGRRCALLDIEVSAGEFKQVHLNCDTGMR